jgi:hypothetical protein
MRQLRESSLVACRDFTLRRPRGRRRIVRALVARPKPFDDGNGWNCEYQILGTGTEKVRHAGGVDSVQALYLALHLIAADLMTTPEYQKGWITWDGSRDLGLPVPAVLADLVPRPRRPRRKKPAHP